ncbi:hypothetical protein D3C78_1221400 [compost metagenome]
MGRTEQLQGRIGGDQLHGRGRVHRHVGIQVAGSARAVERNQRQRQRIAGQLVGLERLLDPRRQVAGVGRQRQRDGQEQAGQAEQAQRTANVLDLGEQGQGNAKQHGKAHIRERIDEFHYKPQRPCSGAFQAGRRACRGPAAQKLVECRIPTRSRIHPWLPTVPVVCARSCVSTNSRNSASSCCSTTVKTSTRWPPTPSCSSSSRKRSAPTT